MMNEQENNNAPSSGDPNDPVSLADELGVTDLRELVFGKHGRLFSAAGRTAPIAEFTDDSLVLHPPGMPFEEERQTEVIHYDVDERGIALNELGQPRRISGAKLNGRPLYVLGEMLPGTYKHLVAWFDDSGKAHRMAIQGNIVTTDMAYQMRNKTHDGELAAFADLESE